MLFRKRLTKKWIEKHFPITWNSLFPARYVGTIDGDNCLAIEMRDNNRFCLVMGYNVSSYWICDLEYVYQLKQMMKIYKIKMMHYGTK